MPMETKRLVLEVLIHVATKDDRPLVTDDSLTEYLSHVLNDHCDGRQFFSVEVMKDGLERAVTSAVERSVRFEADGRYPGRITPSGTNILCQLADAKMRRLEYVRVGAEIVVRELSHLDTVT